MNDIQRYAEYHADSEVLAAIGARIEAQQPVVTVRLPKELAETAVAAWERDDEDELPQEDRLQQDLRDRAAYLALIGLVIQQDGRPDGDEVVVDLPVSYAGVAARATSEPLPRWDGPSTGSCPDTGDCPGCAAEPDPLD
ncbi:hypothetical protein [Kitasatospora sp. NPDC088134]|uniref:hypothetical protein n=1 Tax=Kitasatospora sp. NPDC088134 TaxID=3364071 RepID=UPI003821B325